MPDLNDEVIAVVRQWVVKAESDLTTASHTLQLGEACPTDAVCFHAQQCVEKYLKSLLVLQGIEFSRSHHIGTLITLLPEPIRPHLTPEEQDRLTEYAVTTRYPGDYDPIPYREAEEAVQVARRVRIQVRQNLPETVM